MQIYEDLPIITNKITKEEQQGIPHHLLGTSKLEEDPWTVSLFKKRARSVIDEIHSRGKLPILVGGTHYYTQSLLFNDNLVQVSGDNVEDEHHQLPRAELNRKHPILERSTDEILAQLKIVDPVMADRWHPNDRQKIQRSLEIFLTTGRKASDIYHEQTQRKLARRITNQLKGGETSLLQSTLFFWVHADGEVLKQRLDQRVDKMVEIGLVDEVERLSNILRQQQALGRTVDTTCGIWVSIGFKEFMPYFDTLVAEPESAASINDAFVKAVERTKIATRQYSKRQVRWIRIKLLAALDAEQALRRIYVLDGNDLKNWESAVSGPARRIVDDFLKGKDLPEPTTTSQTAAQLLSLQCKHDLAERPDLWIRKVCEICDMTVVTQEQWDSHLKSRGHRSATKKKQKRMTNSGEHSVTGKSVRQGGI